MKRLTSFIIGLVFLTIPFPAVADISDSIEFPYESRKFDNIYRFGTEYTDSLTLASWNRIRSGKAPFVGDLTIVFSQNVNLQKYSFESELISPSGKVVALSLKSQYISKSEYSFYCWGTTCQTIMLTYGANLPVESEIGKYSLRFTARWLGVKCVGTVCESGISLSKSIDAKGALEILGEPTPTPAPAPTPTPTPAPTPTPTPASPSETNQIIPMTKVTSFNLNNGQIGCSTSEFTKDAIDQYEIIGTRWRIEILDVKNRSRILDEYNLGLSPEKNGKPVSIQTTNGLRFSSKEGNAPIIYAYAIRNQEKGATYECSVAVRTKNGDGPYSNIKFIGTTNSKDFNLQTISCTKGKLSKKVSAVNPKCPAGYKVKK